MRTPALCGRAICCFVDDYRPWTAASRAGWRRSMISGAWRSGSPGRVMGPSPAFGPPPSTQNGAICERCNRGFESNFRMPSRRKMRFSMWRRRRNLIGCCGTRCIRATSRARTRRSLGNEPPVPARRPLMRRRIFLQLSAGAAGAGILHTVGAARPRVRIKAKVVGGGGGFAGAGCAILMHRLDPAIEVTLVDPDDRYVTCPMSNSVLAGFRGIESISVSRLGLQRAGVNYVRDWVTSIDAQPRRVRLAGGTELAYDRLVMAPGIRFLWGSPEGYSRDTVQAMPHAWQAGAQTEILAAQLRGMHDGGVVAISVPPGPMRCPPGPFERASLIAAFLQRAKPRSKVLIFDSNNHFPRQDAFNDAWQSLNPGMIEWIPVVDGGAVIRVATQGKKLLYTSQGAHPVDVANIIPPQAPGIAAVQAGLASDHGWGPLNPPH